MGRSRIQTRDVIKLTIVGGIALLIGYIIGLSHGVDFCSRVAFKVLELLGVDGTTIQVMVDKYGWGIVQQL